MADEKRKEAVIGKEDDGEDADDAAVREYLKRWKVEEARLNKEAQAKAEALVRDGADLAKPELRKEWEDFARLNTKHFYAAGVVESAVGVMRALTEGKEPKEAMDAVNGDITGFQAGMIAASVAHFHERGEEFRRWWNRDNGGTGDEKGTINPAILHVEVRR